MLWLCEWSKTRRRPYWRQGETTCWRLPDPLTATATASGAIEAPTAEAYGRAVAADPSRLLFKDHRARCNDAKRNLHRRFARGHVVDLGGGRGGDLLKFGHHVTEYTCIDGCAAALEEAQRRYSTNANDTRLPRNATFVLCDLRRNPEAIRAILSDADAVSCMFSIHYFAAPILKVLNEALRPGTIVYGIAPDYRRIDRVLRKTQPGEVAQHGDARLWRRHDDDPASPLRWYHFQLGDLVDGDEEILDWPHLERSTCPRLHLKSLQTLGPYSSMIGLFATFVFETGRVHAWSEFFHPPVTRHVSTTSAPATSGASRPRPNGHVARKRPKRQ